MTDAVVVGDAHTSLVKRVQDCLREDKLGLIAPERSIVLHVESESFSNAWQQIGFLSLKLRAAISVSKYQPLNGANGKRLPPISNAISLTAGTAYQRSCRSSSQG